MDERMRFVIRLKYGETMASLCREFGISRKTGYKILERYEQCGVEGLSDRTRRPFRYANQLPEPVGAATVSGIRIFALLHGISILSPIFLSDAVTRFDQLFGEKHRHRAQVGTVASR